MIRRLDAGMLQWAFIWVAFHGRWYRAVRLTVWLWVFGFEGMDFQILGILLIHSCILIHQAPAAAVYDTWVISNFSSYFCIWEKTKKTVLLGYSLSCSKIAYTLSTLHIRSAHWRSINLEHGSARTSNTPGWPLLPFGQFTFCSPLPILCYMIGIIRFCDISAYRRLSSYVIQETIWIWDMGDCVDMKKATLFRVWLMLALPIFLGGPSIATEGSAFGTCRKETCQWHVLGRIRYM